jgi:hypothetical protein
MELRSRHFRMLANTMPGASTGSHCFAMRNHYCLAATCPQLETGFLLINCHRLFVPALSAWVGGGLKDKGGGTIRKREQKTQKGRSKKDKSRKTSYAGMVFFCAKTTVHRSPIVLYEIAAGFKQGAGIFKLLRSPRIDSKESILPANVA